MILVTGAGSLIGGYACRLLHSRGVSFRAAIHKKESSSWNLCTSDSVYMDFLDPDSVQHAMENISTVFFIAPVAHDMIEMARILKETAINTGVTRIVKISAYGGETGDSFSEIGKWHNAADKILHESQIQFIPLRCMPFMQNLFYIAETMIKTHHRITLPCGDGSVSYIDARDISEAACSVLTAPGQDISNEYTLTGREALSYKEIASILTKITGQKIVYNDIDEVKAKQMLTAAGIPEKLTQAKLASFRLEKNNLRSYISPHFEMLTGKAPIMFQEFASEFKKKFI